MQSKKDPTAALEHLSSKIDQLLSVVRGTQARPEYVTDSRHDTLGERCRLLIEQRGDMTVAELAEETGSAISAVGRAVKAVASEGRLTMVSEPVGESHHTWRWRVFLPADVSTRRRNRGTRHSDVRELAALSDEANWAADGL